MLLDNAPSGGGLRMKVSGNYTESGIGELQVFFTNGLRDVALFFLCSQKYYYQKRLSTELIQELCYIVRRIG